MARTLVQIKREMEKLEKEADRVKASEMAGVVERIKAAIEFYGITQRDLFGSGVASMKSEGKGAARKKTTRKKSASPARYMDKQSGKTWTGHGKRPGWFVQALESGMQPQDLQV